PLPNTNAPAFKKKKKRFHKTPVEAAPCRPVSSQPKPPMDRETRLDPSDGVALTTTDITPQRTNNHTISEPVHTVVVATLAKMSQRNRSLPNVFRARRSALWAMIAITAAPMP